MEIERKYIIDESNHKVAVQVDIETFTKIEETLENYGLIQLMQAQEHDDELFHRGWGKKRMRHVIDDAPQITAGEDPGWHT